MLKAAGSRVMARPCSCGRRRVCLAPSGLGALAVQRRQSPQLRHDVYVDGFMPAIGSKIHLTLASTPCSSVTRRVRQSDLRVDTTNMQQTATTITISGRRQRLDDGRLWRAVYSRWACRRLGRWTDVRRSGGALRDGALDGHALGEPSSCSTTPSRKLVKSSAMRRDDEVQRSRDRRRRRGTTKSLPTTRLALYDALPAK